MNFPTNFAEGLTRRLSPRTGGIVVGSIVFLLGCLLVTKPLFDYDLYWHLANGRETLSQGHVVNSEAFSYTQYGKGFSNQWWLAQVIWYAIWSAVGPIGLLLLKIVIGGSVALIVYHTARLIGAAIVPSAMFGVLAPLAGHVRYIERPELFSLLLIAALGLLLHAWKVGASAYKTLALVPLMMVVWDWLHGALYGLVYLTGFVVCANLSHRTRLTEPGGLPSSLKSLNLAFIATILAMGVNPWGLSNYAEYFGLASPEARVAFKRVVEYYSSSWSTNPLFIIVFASAVVAFLANFRKIGLIGPCLVLGFGVLTWEFLRVTGVFMIVCAPYLAVAISRLLDVRHAVVFWATRLVLAAGLVFFSIHAWWIKTPRPGNPEGLGVSIDDQYLPVGSVRFSKYLGLRGNLFNTGHFGGYLAFALYPDAKIFQYNFPKIFGDSYRFINPEGAAELERWNIQYAFVALSEELQLLFPNHAWARIYRDPAGVLVVRRTPEHQKIIDRFEVSVFHPMFPDMKLRELALQPDTRQRALYEALVYLAFRRDDRIAAWVSWLTAEMSGQVDSKGMPFAEMAKAWNPGLNVVAMAK